jgi:outer membrane lipopolysaccharide assembly protein LptE/RlpB
MGRLPRAFRILVLLLIVSLSGCGYHSTLGPAAAARDASNSSNAVPIGRARVTVVALRSDSPEPWLDRIVTDALRREVGGRARLSLTDDPGSAAMQVRGRIRPLDITSRSFSSFVAALEYSLTLALDLEVRLANGDVMKLDPAMLSETDSYLASPDIEVTRTNRLEALRHISDLLAARVADAIELLEEPIPIDGDGAGG